jgi:hypothetical protein
VRQDERRKNLVKHWEQVDGLNDEVVMLL